MSRTDRQNHVLDTARALVLAQGFNAVTLDIAERDAGISRPMLYKLFGGLHGLLTSLIDRETDAALEGLNRAMTGMDTATGTAGEPRSPPCPRWWTRRRRRR